MQALSLGRYDVDGVAQYDIELRNLFKSYGSVTALEALDLTVPRGELLTLLGPSGCGKTTLLRLIAGLLKPSSGMVRIAGKNVTDMPAHRRNIGLVFQSYALFPHQTVAQNVGYGLRMRGVARNVVAQKVAEALALVRLERFAERYPSQLSGGQQQRVALARALILEPSVLLLDEPFAALDKALREEMQLEVRELQRNLGITTIFVTHDQEEALTISDRIAVMNAGRIEQIASPRTLYEEPETEFVLKFIGQSSIFPMQVEEVTDGVTALRNGAFTAETSGRDHGFLAGSKVNAAVRPGKMILSSERPSEACNCVEGKIVGAIYLGTITHYHIDTSAGTRAVVHSQNTEETAFLERLSTGDRVWVQWSPKNTLLFPA
ncbi:ABC transporter ATP-binding protein [Aquamicrobium ahrensii]